MEDVCQTQVMQRLWGERGCEGEGGRGNVACVSDRGDAETVGGERV